MAVTYNTLLREIALAVNALTGATPAQLQSIYSTVPLTAGNFTSSIFPFLGLVDKMLDGEAEVIRVAANTGNHPYRPFLISQTSALAYGATVSTNSAGTPVIGVWGDVREASSGQPLTKNELRQIQDRVINPNDMWLIPVWWYCRSDAKIYHTVTAAIIDVVAYARPNANALDLTSNILLPDIALPTMTHAALMQCIRDDEFMAQGARYGEMFNQWVMNVKAGYSSVDSTSQLIEAAAGKAAMAGP